MNYTRLAIGNEPLRESEYGIRNTKQKILIMNISINNIEWNNCEYKFPPLRDLFTHSWTVDRV